MQRPTRSDNITIGIVAGEASGDALAAMLIAAVRARIPGARFVGIAGPKMEAAGCEKWHPLETLSVGGFTEVVGRLPEILAVRRALKRLDDTLLTIPFQPNLKEPVPPKSPTAPTAAIIVRDFDGVAVHALLTIPRLFPNHFKNVVFISVGVIDSGQFKGHQEIENLRRAKEEDLKSFVEFANCLGWYAEYRYSLGVDLMAELEELCTAVVQDFPKSVFFSGKLVFQEENAMSRFLHNHTPATLQQKLQFAGLDMMILPIRIFADTQTKQRGAAA